MWSLSRRRSFRIREFDHWAAGGPRGVQHRIRQHTLHRERQCELRIRLVAAVAKTENGAEDPERSVTATRYPIYTFAGLGFVLTTLLLVGLILDFRDFDRTEGGYEPPYTDFTGPPVHAGRVWQRLHLLATSHDIAMQPLTSRWNGRPGAGAEEEARPTQVLAALTGDPRWKPTFAFRAGYSEREALASPRREVEQVIA